MHRSCSTFNVISLMMTGLYRINEAAEFLQLSFKHDRWSAMYINFDGWLFRSTNNEHIQYTDLRC